MKNIIYNQLIIACLLLCNLNSFAGSGCGATARLKSNGSKVYYDDSVTIYINKGDTVNLNIFCYGVQEFPFYLSWYKNGILQTPDPIYTKNFNLFVAEQGVYSFVSTSHSIRRYYIVNRYPIVTDELNENSNQFSFFPNPSNDKITIKFKEYSDDVKLTLIDQHGKEMDLSHSFKFNQEIVVDIKEFICGVYFLKYEDKTRVLVKKLIKY